jgi:hypothetical protein
MRILRMSSEEKKSGSFFAIATKTIHETFNPTNALMPAYLLDWNKLVAMIFMLVLFNHHDVQKKKGRFRWCA